MGVGGCSSKCQVSMLCRVLLVLCSVALVFTNGAFQTLNAKPVVRTTNTTPSINLKHKVVKIRSNEGVADEAAANLDDVIHPEDFMEFSLGCSSDIDPVIVYVVPSCLHCGLLLIEELDRYLQKYGQTRGVIVKFIVSSPKDIFIVKMLYNEFKNDKHAIFWTYIDYMKRVIATINKTTASKADKEKYQESEKDPDFIKYQIIAHNFKLSDQKIMAAYPERDGEFEKLAIMFSEDCSDKIAQITQSNDPVKMPLVMADDRVGNEFPD